jgi:REP element-mobilizing transposase RayT
LKVRPFEQLSKLPGCISFIKKYKSKSDTNYEQLKEGNIVNDAEGIAHSLYVSNQFSKLFNSYTKAINKRYNTRGNLFNHRFKRKEVETEEHLITLICYIHNNPVNHGFVSKMSDWPYSSYLSYLTDEYTFLNEDALSRWFGTKEIFRKIHDGYTGISAVISDYLE